MRNNLWSLILILIVGCSQTEQQNNSESQTVNSKINCEKSASFGDISFCLPTIDGMTECYSKPAVNAIANKENIGENTFLAYYLNNATFKQVDSLDKIAYDDYFIIFGRSSVKGLKADQTILDQKANSLSSGYVKENWNDINDKLKINSNFMTVGRPILMESYSPNMNVRSFVMLLKRIINGNEQVLLMTVNIVQIKERLVCLNYYKNYNGEESIKSAKTKNDNIALQFVEVNK